jgi:hypothetical protein
MNKNAYISQVIRALNMEAYMGTDIVNIDDDKP